jgi:hypothetical protein
MQSRSSTMVLRSLSLVVIAGAISALIAAQDPGKKQEKAGQEKPAPVAKAEVDPKAAAIEFQKPCYPLKTCPISNEELGGSTVDELVDGRLVRLCCKDCVAEVAGKKAEIFKSIDAAVIEQQKAAYPMDTCPVSGEKLDETAVDHVHGTRLIRLCCEKCATKVAGDAEPVLKKLNDAYIVRQKSDYPLETCLVSGKPLGSMGTAVDFLYGTRLYRMCCDGCRKNVVKNADQYWKTLADLRAEKKKEPGGLKKS